MFNNSSQFYIWGSGRSNNFSRATQSISVELECPPQYCLILKLVFIVAVLCWLDSRCYWVPSLIGANGIFTSGCKSCFTLLALLIVLRQEDYLSSFWKDQMTVVILICIQLGCQAQCRNQRYFVYINHLPTSAKTKFRVSTSTLSRLWQGPQPHSGWVAGQLGMVPEKSPTRVKRRSILSPQGKLSPPPSGNEATLPTHSVSKGHMGALMRHLYEPLVMQDRANLPKWGWGDLLLHQEKKSVLGRRA